MNSVGRGAGRRAEAKGTQPEHFRTVPLAQQVPHAARSVCAALANFGGPVFSSSALPPQAGTGLMEHRRAQPVAVSLPVLPPQGRSRYKSQRVEEAAMRLLLTTGSFLGQAVLLHC